MGVRGRRTNKRTDRGRRGRKKKGVPHTEGAARPTMKKIKLEKILFLLDVEDRLTLFYP